MAAQTILLIEDDRRLAQLTKEYLEQYDFIVVQEYRGDKAIEKVAEVKPALIILDLMLPGMHGLDVCKYIRPQYHGPILMLTAQDEDVDQIVGLEIGADDYVTKPIQPRVLLARIRTLLRRFNNTADDDDKTTQVVKFGDVMIDNTSRTVTRNEDNIKLTTNEYDLLWLLASHAGSILSRDDLYQQLCGIEHDGVDRSIDIRVSKLRKLIGDNPSNPQLIKTVRGRGYLFCQPNNRDKIK